MTANECRVMAFLRRLLRGRARAPLLTTWEAGK